MNNELMKTVYARRSTRSYTSLQISDEELNTILEAGLWAPTARNEQEIVMAVVQDKEIMAQFNRDFINDGGRTIRPGNFYYDAPTFIFMYGPKSFSYTEIDTGIVAQSMALAAESLGLGSVIIGCIRDFMRAEAAQPWRERFGMGEDDIFTLGLAVGHIDKETPKRDRKENRIIQVK